MANIRENTKNGKVISYRFTVCLDRDAQGKQIRDVLWPANLFVLSLRHDPKGEFRTDGHGSKEIRAGDVLHVRFAKKEGERTEEELLSVVGEQEILPLEGISPENESEGK